MTEFDFYDVVKILDTEANREVGVASSTGIIVGKAEGEQAGASCAVLVGDETYSLNEEAFRYTGKKVSRDELYGGESVHVSHDGSIVTDDPESSNSSGQ